jgi:Ca-activated chloride channel homolog
VIASPAPSLYAGVCMNRLPPIVSAIVAVVVVSAHGQQAQQPPVRPGDEQGFRFRSGVELVNVTATVSDTSGRFVPGLKADDFLVYEDNQPVEVTHFSAERVPVSLGIAIDTSGSMAGEKIQEAQTALDRFVFELLDKQDEFFIYRFSNYPTLLQGWTSDRQLLTRAIGRISANGGTAMYDTIAEAIPLAQQGQNRKKALLVISDGNDTASSTGILPVKQLIRESEVLVYAIGIDGESSSTAQRTPPPRAPMPVPFPFPGGRRRPGQSWPQQPPSGGGRWRQANDERVNVVALRDMTDDSGGRTEIIRDAHDLNPATSGIADELSRQYYLGYRALGNKDGRWHSIRVEARNRAYRVRARRGYIAS